MPNAPIIVSVTIASAASLSGAARTDGHVLVGIIMPSAWTAADLTFQASADNNTFNDLYTQAGSEKTVTAAASEYIVVDHADFVGIGFLKVRSGTSGTPVNQAAARTLQLVLREIA